jgi:hypothetical protein
VPAETHDWCHLQLCRCGIELDAINGGTTVSTASGDRAHVQAYQFNGLRGILNGYSRKTTTTHTALNQFVSVSRFKNEHKIRRLQPGWALLSPGLSPIERVWTILNSKLKGGEHVLKHNSRHMLRKNGTRYHKRKLTRRLQRKLQH